MAQVKKTYIIPGESSCSEHKFLSIDTSLDKKVSRSAFLQVKSCLNSHFPSYFHVQRKYRNLYETSGDMSIKTSHFPFFTSTH